MLSKELFEGLLKTLAYYQIMQKAPSLSEIQENFLHKKKPEHFELLESLNYLVSLKILGESEGFYFPQENFSHFKLRKQRYLLFLKKIKKAKKIIKLLVKMPFIEAVFISNSLAEQNANTKSDIDLFIIATEKRIFTARFFGTLLLKILNARPTKKTKQDRLCLSFWISKDNLNIEKTTEKNDIHLAFLIKNLWPIYTRQEQLITEFFKENIWLKNFFATVKTPTLIANFSLTKKTNCLEKVLKGKLGNSLEKILKHFQLLILPTELKRKMKEKTTAVIINDQILKTHLNDKRTFYRKKWQNRYKNLQNSFAKKKKKTDD